MSHPYTRGDIKNLRISSPAFGPGFFLSSVTTQQKMASLKNIAELTEPESAPEVLEIDQLVSLDDLFSQLASETAPQENENSEFEKIQLDIQKLPKIESSLEQQMREASQAKQALPNQVIKIDDPITNPPRKADRKKERELDAGKDWFSMKKKELTPELKRDMLVIKNRAVLDRKRHYKKDKWEIPKYFHTGTIIEGNTESLSARLAKRNRGRSLAEEILHDDDLNAYFKKKYYEIQEQKMSGGRRDRRKVIKKRKGYRGV